MNKTHKPKRPYNNRRVNQQAPERIQKFLANLGVASRREVERMIEAGRITVNNKPATLGQAVDYQCKIKLDGKPLRFDKQFNPTTRCLLYYKPEGELCTRSDPQDRKTVFDKLPRLHQGRWICVGRLDLNSQGLLLLTNHGELANRLMHPSYEIEREYAVRVLGELSEQQQTQLLQGIQLDDGLAKFLRIDHQGGEGVNQWYHVVLKEGRNREVRRLFEACNLKVSRLVRIRFGPIILPRTLKRGRFIELDKSEQKQLLKAVKLTQFP